MKKLIPIAAAVLLLIMILTCRGGDFQVNWTSVNYPSDSLIHHIKIKMYIENSGSMDGYMCEGAELKDAVYGYVSTMKSYADTLELNYINSQIVPYDGTLQNFVRDLNVATFKKVGGNRSNSDISDMFEQMLSRADENTITIFVSDCILDVPQGDAKDYLTNRQIDIRNTFVSKLRSMSNLGVEVFRLFSKFEGQYYYDKESERLQSVNRPYFMWLIGDKNILAYLNAKIPSKEIKHGVTNYCAYSTYMDAPFEITNQFNVIQNPCIDKKPREGHYTIKIRTDLSTTLQTDDILKDTANYMTQNNMVRVNSVERISESQGKNTHLLTLYIDENIPASREQLSLCMPELPLWLESANDETGANVKDHINQTTGIKNIISGVSEAYREHRVLVRFNFVINN